MSVENNLPAIRFEGFSGEWDFQTIDKLIREKKLLPPKDGNHGGIHPKSSDYIDFGIPFIMANNIKRGEIDVYNCSHIRKEQADSLQKGFAIEGDVLLTHKGTVGEVAVVPKNEFPYLMLTPQVTYYRILNSDFLNKFFLAASFTTRKFQGALKLISGGGTRAYIGITAQHKLQITVPPKPQEQTKIGNYFQQLDTLIAQHQQKHDKLLNLKKALLEKMFPKQDATEPEIRFKGFSGEWEEKALGDVTTITMGQSPNGDNYTENPEDHILVQGNADMKNGFVKPRIWTTQVTKKANAGDLIFSVRAPVGEIGKTTYDLVIGRGVAAIRANEFIFQCLIKMNLDGYWKKISAGSTFDSINSSDLSTSVLQLATSEEQTKIGNLFKQLDTLITQHQTQHKKLGNIKQACLEKMFV